MCFDDSLPFHGDVKNPSVMPVLRQGMIYFRIGAGQTLVALTRRSIPWRLRVNPVRQLWVGRGSTIEPDLHLVLDRVGRWSLDDVE